MSVARSYDSSREMLRAAKVILKINFPSIMKRTIFQAWQLLSGPNREVGNFSVLGIANSYFLSRFRYMNGIQSRYYFSFVIIE